MPYKMYEVEVERVDVDARSIETWTEYVTATSADEAVAKSVHITRQYSDPADLVSARAVEYSGSHS